MVNKIKRFDRESWRAFGRGLLSSKDPDKQKDFLKACNDGKNTFLSYMRDALRALSESYIIGEEELDFNLLREFGEDEIYQKPPDDIQTHIWKAFKNLPKEIVADEGFWGYVVFKLVENDKIRPQFLARNGAGRNGAETIGLALKAYEKLEQKLALGKSDGDEVKKLKKAIDDCTRRILRSMCNPVPRGRRIIFNDFSLGKAYWRREWASRMSNEANLGLGFDRILQLLDETNYVRFSEKMQAGWSYISSKNILGGLLLFLDEAHNKGDENKDLANAKMVTLIDNISYLSAWKALEAQSFEKNKAEIQRIFDNLVADDTPPPPELSDE